MSNSVLIDEIDAFVFDFDGVLTNNMVYLNEQGEESVSCSRADGLAFDVLRKLGKPVYILSTETNPVVTARAQKLKVDVLQGAANKVEELNRLVEKNNYSHSRILYVGNDVNDYKVMLSCGYTACPADSHETIKGIATVILDTCGGEGVVRELLEKVMSLDLVEILYK